MEKLEDVTFDKDFEEWDRKRHGDNWHHSHFINGKLADRATYYILKEREEAYLTGRQSTAHEIFKELEQEFWKAENGVTGHTIFIEDYKKIKAKFINTPKRSEA